MKKFNNNTKLGEPEIVHTDQNMMVINKPSGWIVNEAKTTGGNPVVQTWLKENLNYTMALSNEHRSGIVHRLDKETSGIMLIAKTEGTFYYLQALFKERKVKKSYTALVHGECLQTEGEISDAVGRLPWNRERFGVLPGGREAVTQYKVLSYFSKKSVPPAGSIGKKPNRNLKTPEADKKRLYADYTLLELFPKTGRTHQIRIHLKHLGHPIVSDLFYAGRKTARRDRMWCPRLFLHAASITFNGIKGKKMSFTAKLPEDLLSALNSLEKLQ
jgi:23S rRNA pseudouridine1911/1915/1917 synthase